MPTSPPGCAFTGLPRCPDGQGFARILQRQDHNRNRDWDILEFGVVEFLDGAHLRAGHGFAGDEDESGDVGYSRVKGGVLDRTTKGMGRQPCVDIGKYERAAGNGRTMLGNHIRL